MAQGKEKSALLMRLLKAPVPGKGGFKPATVPPPAPPVPATAKRGLDPDVVSAAPVDAVRVPAVKKARVEEAPDAAGKRPKKREVQDPSAVFLADPSVSQRGVLVFDKIARKCGVPDVAATELLPLRHEQNSHTLAHASDQWPWLDAQTDSDGVRAQSIMTLLGPSQLVRDVPLGEALIMTHREFNDRLSKMLQLRIAQALPTGLDQASGAVRLASGLPAVPPDPATAKAERDKRLPPLIGLPATTLAKTRQTWLAGGQLVVNNGFTHDNTRGSLLRVTSHYNADYAQLFEAFFSNDAAEVRTGARPYMRPDDFAMFRQLRADHGDRFARNDHFLENAALNVSRVPPPVQLWRKYIYLFRFPPRPELGEDECARGQECNSVKTALRLGSQTVYVARRLLLPDELTTFERTGQLPPGRGLCFDCELEHYQECVYTTLSNLRIRTQPINRFTVRCEKGEFDVRDMMPNIVNGRVKTGIVGYVPKYRRSMYQLLDAVRPDDPDGPVRGKKIRILNDLSLNF